MKRLTFIVAMLFVFACLMADITASVAPRNENTTQERYPNRDIFYSEDFESGATGWTSWDGAVSPNNWHIYDNGDAQGDVWWMGDPALAADGNIGGYYDHQYLVLDTPEIPISAGNCTLTFMMRHGLEEPGVSAPYDGWDSFNLRISTNSGLSYTVIPDTTAIISPVYDFENSYAFGSEHGEGLGIPGWGGIREWTQVTVDLTDYLATPNVKIRFAFASDPAYSTADQSDLYGVMVDDIALASYTNNGVDDGQMTWTSLVPTAGDFWHVAEDATAPSPTHIMSSANTAGTYVPFMLDYLESPTISLPGTATQIIADFQVKGTFYDAGVFPDVDYFGWEIWHNGSWHYMSNITDDPDGMNYVYSSAPDNWASMINSYAGVDGDITIFAGDDVKFRWYFQSDGDTPIGTPLQIDDFQLFAQTEAPGAPNLYYPPNNATNLPITGFNLQWTASSQGATPEYYYVYMDTDLAAVEGFYAAYTSNELTTNSCPTDSIPDLTFSSAETWYWMVEAGITGQPSAYSEIYRFDIVDTSQAITTFPWVENFDAALALPDSWMVVDVDADGTTWAPTDAQANSAPNAFWHNYSSAVPDPGQNGWLITPPIQLPVTGYYVFSWYNYNVWPGDMVYNGVKINTTNDPSDPNWLELWSQDAASEAWTNGVVNLSDYAGEVVYLAFNYQGYYADEWYIDDVSIFELTDDLIPPTITHLPVLNTPRPDINYLVYADIADDALWNNPITVANVYYSIDDGTTWSAPIAMTLDVAPGYYANIPAQPLGTTVTYYIEASDSEGNIATTSNFAFDVNDPTWIQYDTGGTSYTGFPTYVWGPMIYYENPLYGTGIPLQLMAVDGAVYNNNTGNPPTLANLHVYAEDLEGNLTDLITPIPVTFQHTTPLETDLSALNIQITTPWFWISYEDMPTGCYFLYDDTYDYTTLYLMVSGDGIYYSSSPGEWCIGAYVQSVMGIEAPIISIAMDAGYPTITWAAVTGAASYNVYGSNDPMAADPWTLLGNTVNLSYPYMGTEVMEFFKVTADTEVPARGTILSLPENPGIDAPMINTPLKAIRTEFTPVK